nr:MAG TPA: hypothetical protein [Caudoviricetes sp.]
MNRIGNGRRETILIQEVWLYMENIKNLHKDIPLGTADTVFIVADGTFCDAEFFGQFELRKPGLLTRLTETAGKGHGKHLLKNIVLRSVYMCRLEKSR